MGLKFKDIVVPREIATRDLAGKILAVDSMNLLYQFLTTIRGVDGSPLTDSQGRVTSHLIGLFNRATSLMEDGLKLAFVFDGQPPEIKRKTQEKRKSLKQEATLKLQEAEELGDYAEMRKHAARAVFLTKEMIEDAQRVITTLGCPIIQAPSEGEAQTAYMVAQGDAYASISQDYDNLIFGCPRLVRNLSIAGKRKKTGKVAFVTIKPEMITLQDVLANLHLTQDQLIVLAILVGTDYNPGGIKGLGPKKGLKLVQQHGEDFAALFKEIHWEDEYPTLFWKEIFDIIKKIPVTNKYHLEWKQFNEEKLTQLLVGEHNFSEERVKAKLEKLQQRKRELSQKGLHSFF